MRALARWGIAPLLAAPLGAWALGLGDIELQSALNQPFRAEITLSATPEELQGLRVTLAGVDTFELYGVDRPQFLTALEFRVAAGRDGRPLIQVTSRESIAEPFVTLLVEASWSRGRTLREYTVLLDPPLYLPAPAAPPAVRPAETRAPAANEPGGPISRPAPPPAAPQPAPAPRVEPPPAGPVSSSPPPSPRVPEAAPGSTYGPVRRAETLWAIANRNRPDGVTINQMMIAVYQANPQAFGGNINLLRAGATLRLPETRDFDTLAATVANAEVQRQTDEWLNRPTQRGQLRLLPPAEAEVTRTPAPAPAPAPATSPADAAGGGAAAADDVAAAVEESRRLLEVRDAALQDLQQQAASEEPPVEAPAAPTEPGVDLEAEGEQVFADETPEPAPAAEETPAPAPAPRPVAAEPSFVSQALGWVLSPVLWIGLGVTALLLTALWYMRRRREEQPEDVTGRWEALESEVADDEVREATARMRRQVPEETIVVEEQQPERRRAQAGPEDTPRGATAARGSRAAPSMDDTLSSQTVINLDQADAVAEADFHMAYGLYDQAAELVQKALDAAPNRRDLKLKLLEVFFVWGNKDAFLKAAQGLREEIGHGGDADWDKVVIMGRQICPDERLFTEATTGSGAVDVDLQAGSSPLDLAFDEGAAGDDVAGGLDFNLEASGELPAPTSAARANVAAAHDLGDSALDIGERTAAGLEAALFAPDDESNQTLRDLMAEHPVPQDSLASEPRGGRGWTSEAATTRLAPEAKPTTETSSADAPTLATPTMETSYRLSSADQPGIAGAGSDFTAEIDLDDLGLDVKDFEGAPTDLGDVGQETDTREQPALAAGDALLSATGVTQVLRDGDEDHDIEQRKTSVLADQNATVLAPVFDGTLTGGTGVLEGRFKVDEQTGDASLVNTIGEGAGLDLDLADLTAALHGPDTVEQPRATAFSRDVFAGGETPLDLDIGSESIGVDEHAGTEELRSLDPQTMTEVGTKLDLARAYIDMGDPEGARSILEEVLDEGDPNQRREAQGLIDVLSA